MSILLWLRRNKKGNIRVMEEGRVRRTNEFEDVKKNARKCQTRSFNIHPCSYACQLFYIYLIKCFFLDFLICQYLSITPCSGFNDTYQNLFISNTTSKYNDIAVYSSQPMYFYSYLTIHIVVYSSNRLDYVSLFMSKFFSYLYIPKSNSSK